MTMETARILCALSDIPDQGAIELELDGDSIVVLRYGDCVSAFLNICPHAGRPLNWAPGKFLLSAGQLVCASHGAAFRPEDGFCIGGPCRGQSLKAVPIRLAKGIVLLAS
jgi:nitrite reductase/ring-hydroxylating ferredoxin subunit